MGPEELVNLFQDWNYFLLIFLILGAGYVGLCILELLNRQNIYFIPNYNKIIRTLLLGLTSFVMVFSLLNRGIAQGELVYQTVARYWFSIFVTTTLGSIALAFLVYYFESAFFDIKSKLVKLHKTKKHFKRFKGN